MYDVMWENMAVPDRSQMTVQWITKAADTHSECVILFAFPRQQWLHEGSPLLHDMYIAFLVTCLFKNCVRQSSDL